MVERGWNCEPLYLKLGGIWLFACFECFGGSYEWYFRDCICAGGHLGRDGVRGLGARIPNYRY